MQSVCIFCGSNFGEGPAYEAAAKAFGRALVNAGCALVYGGGKIGLMGVVADSVLSTGGKAIGVMPQVLIDKEQAHGGLTQMHVVADMSERKKKMAELADGFVALPGGLGTYEELFEVLSWAQLRLHEKPIGALNVNGFFNPLQHMLEETVKAGFMRRANCSLLVVHENADQLLTGLKNYRPEHAHKWLPHGGSADS